MTILFCIFTCEKDRDHLAYFKTQPLYEHARINFTYPFDVYAGSFLNSIEGNQIHLACEEDYSKLSLKTYNLVKFLIEKRKFDFLIKTDCTLFSRIFEIDHLKKFVTNRLYESSQYTGIGTFKMDKEHMTEWAEHRSIKNFDYDRVFEDKKTTRFYGGKFYCLGRNFCEFIAKEGEEMAIEHAKYLGGSEDLMVGRLWQRYRTL